MSLQEIFDLIENKSHSLRLKNSNADGQKFWKPIKEILSNINIKVEKWKNVNDENKKIMLMPEFIIDGYGNKKIIEINHFIIQTIRIPLTEEPSLRKIIQIALNIGQYTGSGGKKNKWMKLENYLTANNINKINNSIKKLNNDENYLLNKIKKILNK